MDDLDGHASFLLRSNPSSSAVVGGVVVGVMGVGIPDFHMMQDWVDLRVADDADVGRRLNRIGA